MSAVIIRRSAVVFALLILGSACGTTEDSLTVETTAGAEQSSTTVPTPNTSNPDQTPTTRDSTTTAVDSAVSTTEAIDPIEPPDAEPEPAMVCDAYLRSITPGHYDDGLNELIRVVGTDAPTLVLDAFADLTGPPVGGIESFYAARDAIDEYVLPLCSDQFAASVTPAESSAFAADLFFAAVVQGDEDQASRLAPSNVVVQFEWPGFPDANTTGYSDVDGSFSMTLEPTVTVFCRASGGVVSFCAFGE